MSGHSKWSTIKRQKGAADAKRGQLFTKLGRAITVAAKEGGGDIDANPSLRLAVESAKRANMPKDNIEKAIQRGTGELAGDNIESILFEGYGPAGVAFIIETLTDNNNRTVSDVRSTLTKYGGSLGNAGSVLWMFERNGVVRFASSASDDKEALALAFIDAGADDIQEEDGYIAISTKPEHLQHIKNKAEEFGKEVLYAEIEYIVKNPVPVNEDVATKVEKLVEVLEDLDDVTAVTTSL